MLFLVGMKALLLSELVEAWVSYHQESRRSRLSLRFPRILRCLLRPLQPRFHHLLHRQARWRHQSGLAQELPDPGLPTEKQLWPAAGEALA